MKKSEAARKEAQQRANLKHLYGITLEEYNAIFIEQDGVCAICGNIPGVRRLVVDHDHNTGKIRGLLCNKCNRALGYASENIEVLEAMIEYITEYYVQ